MPNVFLDGKPVPELQGAVRGGVTVVLHNPADIDALIAVCELIPRPPESPLKTLVRALKDPDLNFDEWRLHRQATQAAQPRTTTLPDQPEGSDNDESAETGFDPGPLLDSDIHAFVEALKIAQSLWLARPEETSLLTCFAVVADEDTNPTRKLAVESNAAAFAVHRGSLLGAAVRLPLYPVVFCVGLVQGGGATPSARVSGLVDRLREKAVAETGSTLSDVRTLSAPDIKNKQLVVLVHGLFCSDVGSFPELEARLQGSSNMVVAGYPHDSVMTSVTTNGHELAQILVRLEPSPRSVRFVCHSRGGLVVRSAAALLAGEPQYKAMLGGYATFGTPHMGSPIAESPGALVASGAILITTSKTKSALSLLDLLSCISYSGSLPGIDDLQPPRRNDTYLSRFAETEGLFPDTHMPLLAFGGVRKPRGIPESIASQVLGRTENDLVVPLASSLPRVMRGASVRMQGCDHYSYFTSERASHIQEAVTFVKNPPVH